MTIRIKLDMIDANTGDPISVTLDVPERPAYLQRLTLVDNLDQPVVSVPFHLHGGTSLHTICRLNSDEVESVEW